MKEQACDVVIIGGGISGTALLFTLARYSDIRSIVLLEKYGTLAPLNSNARGNSQTLHCGDIETNYSLDKAVRVKQVARMIVNARDVVPDVASCLRAYPKMVLGVGDEEVAYLRQRHETFAEAFPYMKLWERERIRDIEPDVAMVGEQFRSEPIVASGCTDEVCAVNYGELSAVFAQEAQRAGDRVTVRLNTKVIDIKKQGDTYTVKTDHGIYRTGFVAVCAGAHSLYLAHQLGYGDEFSLLPVAGSFYFVPRKFNGKVYTVQDPKLPFAAIHADPDMTVANATRLGPTALLLPKLERYKPGTYLDFLKVLKPDKAVIKVFWDLFKDPVIRNYIIRNILFEVPYVQKRLFLQDARKIIPSLQLDELRFAKGYGGLRPQIINRRTEKLQLGEAFINPGTGVLFNITPSPGASTCMGTAYRNGLTITDHVGFTFDRDALVAELLNGVDLPDAQ